jgi:hypothetical protein
MSPTAHQASGLAATVFIGIVKNLLPWRQSKQFRPVERGGRSLCSDFFVGVAGALLAVTSTLLPILLPGMAEQCWYQLTSCTSQLAFATESTLPSHLAVL